MAGAIAAAFRPEDVPLPFESWVRGVTLHDRGYGELDDDPIGETSQERWCEIETRGFRARSGDDIADLVVALHIRLPLDPWPLAVPFLRCVAGGFEANGYPDRLEPIVGIVELCAS